MRCDISISLFFGGMKFKRAEGKEDVLPTSEEIMEELEKKSARRLLASAVVRSIEKG